MTGLIEWVEVQLKPIVNSSIDSETFRYGGMDEFYALNEESMAGHEYVVAWTDTLSGKGLGRGLFIRGNHNRDPERREREAPRGPYVSVPGVFPFSLLNRGTLRVFNSVLYRARPSRTKAVAPLGPFFYPLDSLGAYHRIYGPGGMIQWQGLIPSQEAVGEVLAASVEVGGSFLTVLKVMGDRQAAGLMSFSGKKV